MGRSGNIRKGQHPNSLDNLKKGQWKKGQSGNPKGQPKRLLSNVCDELKAEGYAPVNAQQVKEAYLTVVGLDEEKLNSILQDRKYPMLVRVVVRRLLMKDGFEVLERMLDRAVGRPQQFIDHTTKDKEINSGTIVNVKGMTIAEIDAEIAKHEAILRGEYNGDDGRDNTGS